MSAYSATPLARKLGIKEGSVIRLYHQPPGYRSLFTDWPENVITDEDSGNKKDLIHFFTQSAEELHHSLPGLKDEIRPNGAIWISWPKKASKVPTDLTEDVIRQLALAAGLVDIKVCSVDDTWSGLKLVIPLKDRKEKKA
jgi:hypothetical protein